MPLAEKRRFLKDIRQRLDRVAESWVDAACSAKGHAPGSPSRGEEWLSGPMITARVARLLEESLGEVEKWGRPRLDRAGGFRKLEDGRLAVKVHPQTALDRLLLPGTEAEIHLQRGIDVHNIEEHQASFFRSPHSGRLCAVLGAGNVNAIPPTDCLQKLFVEGTVCVLKMNPVNAYLGEAMEGMFEPLIRRGFFAVVYGGAEEGGQLAQHEAVDEIHITGSDKTHDALVWGTGDEAVRRRREGTPLLKKEITSELGNVTPIVVVPGPYTEKELGFQAKNIAGMVVNNASFNCNSAKLLVTQAGSDGRRHVLDGIAGAFETVPPRRAWYPGASERWHSFVDGREHVRTFGEESAGKLPWALIEAVDNSKKDDRVFTTEPWCSLLSETALPESSLEAFLERMVSLLNGQVWGTLCVGLVVHPQTWETPSSRTLLERAILRLRYGTVAINTWPASAFALGTTPWGGHPSSTLENIQSGRGMVHNTLMLEGIEKAVVHAPLAPMVKPPWWPGHRSLDSLGKTLFELEQNPSVMRLMKLLPSAMKT